MNRLLSILAAPLLCLFMLGGMIVQQSSRLRPDDAVVRAYHARAKESINRMPWRVEVGSAVWTAQERRPEPAAVRLLRPNDILSRHYVQNVTSSSPLTADLLVVQCRDSRDMVGHYPPISYKNTGHEIVHRERRSLEVRESGRPAQTVTFTEYEFEKYVQGHPHRQCVYNFFVVPGRGVVPDIDGVHEAAESYERRFFGAAQFQVLMPVVMNAPRQTRDEVFAALLRSHPTLIEDLKSDGLSQ
jgi:hypothetical protein